VCPYYDMDASNYGYPAGTPGAEKDGYYHRLTESQELALLTVQRWVVDNQLDMSLLSKHALHPSLTLLRYLRANNFDTEKTIDHLKKSIKWRKSIGVDDIISQDPESVLGFPVSELMESFPHYHVGYDLSGRPVMYKQYALFDASRLMLKTDSEHLIKYHVWEQEACMRLCKEQSLKTGYIVETTTTVLDLKDMRLAQVNKDFLAFVKSIAAVDSKYYPETLGKMFVINAPSAFPFVWRMVKMWLDPDVASKIQVLSNNKEWFPILSECIGIDNLAGNYGGKAKPLNSTTMHPYEDSMELLKRDKDFAASRSLSKVTDVYRSISHDEEEAGSSYKSLSDHNFVDAKELASEKESSDALGQHIVGIDKRLQSVEWDEELAYLRTIQPSSPSKKYDDSNEEKRTSDASPKVHSFDPLWIFDYILGRFSPAELRRLLGSSLKLHMCLAIALLILAAYSISTTHWVSLIAKMQMWTGIVMLLISTAMVTLNFSGFLGWWYQNKALLTMYACCQAVAAFVYLIVAFASLLYATVPEISGYSKTAVDRAISDSSSRQQAIDLLNQYNTLLGVSSFLAFLFTLVPVGLSFAYSRRFGYSLGAHNKQQQLRIVLKVAQGVSIATALCMLVYGGRSLEYLFTISFDATVFPIFGLIYGGVAILLCAAAGLWVSETSRAIVAKFYYKICQPLLIAVLLVVTSVSLGSIPGSGVVVNSHFSSLLLPHSDTSEEDVVLAVQTQLLVAGILSVFVCLFQIVSLVTAYKLHAIMVNHRHLGAGKSEGSSGTKQVRRVTSENLYNVLIRILRDPIYNERLCIFWACLMGIYNIFFNGTFVVLGHHFNKNMKNPEDVWAAAAWKAFSRADERYMTRDNFLVCSSAFNALVTGPLVLVYGWATFVRAPFRHICGIVASILMLYQEVIFYSMGINSGLMDFHKDNTADLCAVLIPAVVFLVVFPALVLKREFDASNASTSRADTYDVIVGIEDSYDDKRGSTIWGGSQSAESNHSIGLSSNGLNKHKTRPTSPTGSSCGTVDSLSSRQMSLGAAISIHEGSVLTGKCLRPSFSDSSEPQNTSIRSRTSSAIMMV